MRVSLAVAALAASVVSAKDIWIQVTNNRTANATTVFSPAQVTAVLGDTVWFNFTNGTHSATQSTFASPCIPAHDANVTINGFDSGMRPAGNGTAITSLPVPITPQIANTTIWFYDRAACGGGAVGVINANDSSLQTLAGFQRNAMRLNGTATTSSAHPSATGHSGGSSGGSNSTSTSSNSNGAATLVIGALAAVPLALIGLVL